MGMGDRVSEGGMTAPAYVAVMVLCWVALIAFVVAIFHAAKWIDDQVEKGLNAIAPVLDRREP